MRRRVARMIGVREPRCDRRVELIRTYRPISKLRVPAGNHRVVVSDVDQRVNAGGARRILVEPILGDLLAGEIIPGLDGSNSLPEKSQASGRKRSSGGRDRAWEVLHLGELSGHLGRVACGWRTGSELAT